MNSRLFPDRTRLQLWEPELRQQQINAGVGRISVIVEKQFALALPAQQPQSGRMRV